MPSADWEDHAVRANPLDLISQSDRALLEAFAEASRTDAAAAAAALIESGIAALRLTRAGLDGSSAVRIAGRANLAGRRG